ncbi:MAG: hypothetical protein KDB14_32035 [Planctomycetales bacterium]|nr:hypothetical protein [Planctomycetales bacterium]
MPNHTHLSHDNGHDSAIGWISIAELFLLVGVVMIGVSAMLDDKAVGSQAESQDLRTQVALVEKQHATALEALGTAEATRLRAEATRDAAVQQLKDANDSLTAAQQAATAAQSAADEARKTAAAANQSEQAAITQLKAAESAKQTADRLRADAERKLAEAANHTKQAAAIQARLNVVERELAAANTLIAKYRTAWGQMLEQYKSLETRLELANARVLKPLDNDRIVITLSCQSLPSHLDLDLYVQDPNDRICYWRDPRVLEGVAETAILIPSEDLKQVQSSDSTSQVEEKYFSTMVASGHDMPFLVFCMLRNTSDGAEALAELSQPITVNWRLELKAPDGSIGVTKTGEVQVTRSGAVVYEKSYQFTGLTPIVGLGWTDMNDVRITPSQDLPPVFRGWRSTTVQENAKTVRKIRESAEASP